MALNAQDDESLDRLEQALNRIEAGVERPDPVAGEVAVRLDAIIARLQAHLQEGSRDGLQTDPTASPEG